MARFKRFVGGTVVALAVLATPALADITISQAEITGGRLMISGRLSDGNQVVRIDNTDHRTQSGNTGFFHFRLPYLPPSCMVSIVSELDRFDDVVIGNCGPRGEIGPAGPQGDAGPAGAAGAGGDQGPAGLRGFAGRAGPAGPLGEPGPAGPQGNAGPAGAAGAGGDQGPAGLRGFAGRAGPAGPQGEPGPAGPQGDAGPAGPQGDPGAEGPLGAAGAAGADGAQGPAGLRGFAGRAGPVGPDVFVHEPTGGLKVCVGMVRWGGRAENPQPQENYMIVVPNDWTRQQCGNLFATYAGPPDEGARGGVIRVGCLFPDAPVTVWEGDPQFDRRSCGW